MKTNELKIVFTDDSVIKVQESDWDCFKSENGMFKVYDAKNSIVLAAPLSNLKFFTRLSEERE